MSGGRVDITLRCPTCGRPADVCFDHGDVWKQPGLLERDPTVVHRMTEHELRARVNEFTEDDPPPYGVRVAALFVDPAGVYAGLPDVDVWDEPRDARLYAGPWPVVAHPPCARWCQLAPMNFAIYGKVVGDDGGCFEAALNAVHTYGGVLEHPAYSYAWPRFGLPKPQTKGGWSTTLGGQGFSCYIEQGAYGHVIRKPTWLYVYGVDPPAMLWQSTVKSPDEPGWYVRHDRGSECKRRGAERIRDKRASATPLAFRDALLGMARSVPDLAPASTSTTALPSLPDPSAGKVGAG